jgi:hypothetical protein
MKHLKLILMRIPVKKVHLIFNVAGDFRDNSLQDIILSVTIQIL